MRPYPQAGTPGFSYLPALSGVGPVAKKKTTKKKTTKSSATRKTTKKKSTKKTAKKSTKKVAKKSTKKKTAKKSTKKAAGKKTAKKKTTKAKAAPKTAKKKTTKKKAAKKAAPVPVKPKKKIKTKLTAKKLKHFQELLIEKRVELIGDIVGMEDAALRGRDASNLSTMPLHMADAGSDTYDQDLMLGLMESERKLLIEIDEALGRIADKTFGVCLATGQMINQARLEAKPWAKYCIEAARVIERNGGRIPANME
jgi:DnaK suppressor protein